jgi:hypothetical protein
MKYEYLKYSLHPLLLLPLCLVYGQKKTLQTEILAEFQGGFYAMSRWLNSMQKSIGLDKNSSKPYINYEVTIGGNGKVSNVKSMHHNPNQNDLRYMKALYDMSKWKAARLNGRSISSKTCIRASCTGNED